MLFIQKKPPENFNKKQQQKKNKIKKEIVKKTWETNANAHTQSKWCAYPMRVN